ncbi:MAG: DUF3945 domain-containing protein [Bacteroidales bacterium]|nr:DUF3945 domain-containing protein [Bacteroidales bacterium]
MENDILQQLANLGVSKTEISIEELAKLQKGKMSEMLNFTVPYSEPVKDFLDKENVNYTIENDKIKFSGKVKAETINEAEDTEKNRRILDDAKIEYETVPNKARVSWIASSAFAIGVTAINPMIGIIVATRTTLRLIAQKRSINNSFNMANPDLKKLKNGEIVIGTDKFGRNVLRQLDKDTNTIMSVKVDTIKIPNTIFNTDLTHKQKKILKAGGTIKIDDENGNSHKVRLDLTNDSGLASMKKKNGREIEREKIGFKL